MAGLLTAAKKVEAQGRKGDTILAHINEDEALLLHRLTNGASVNPKTGLLEFNDGDDGNDGGDDDDDDDDNGDEASHDDGHGENEDEEGPDDNDEDNEGYGTSKDGNYGGDYGGFGGQQGFDGYGNDNQGANDDPTNWGARSALDEALDMEVGKSYAQNYANRSQIGVGFVDRAINAALDNPVTTAIDTAIGFGLGPLGALNTGVKAVTGYSIGGAITAAARGLSGYTGYNEAAPTGAPGATTGPEGSLSNGYADIGNSPGEIGALSGITAEANEPFGGQPSAGNLGSWSAPAVGAQSGGLLSAANTGYMESLPQGEAPMDRFNPDRYRGTYTYDAASGRVLWKPAV